MDFLISAVRDRDSGERERLFLLLKRERYIEGGGRERVCFCHKKGDWRDIKLEKILFWRERERRNCCHVGVRYWVYLFRWESPRCILFAG